jgi:hypothetical protein
MPGSWRAQGHRLKKAWQISWLLGRFTCLAEECKLTSWIATIRALRSDNKLKWQQSPPFAKLCSCSRTGSAKKTIDAAFKVLAKRSATKSGINEASSQEHALFNNKRLLCVAQPCDFNLQSPAYISQEGTLSLVGSNHGVLPLENHVVLDE